MAERTAKVLLTGRKAAKAPVGVLEKTYLDGICKQVPTIRDRKQVTNVSEQKSRTLRKAHHLLCISIF